MTEETLITSADTNQSGEAATAAEGKLPEGQTTTTAEGQPAEKTDDSKPADGEKPAADAEYVITAPEGVELDTKQTEAFTALAKELKLAPADAQKIADIAIQAQVAEAQARAEMVNGWADQVRADKDIGGDKLTETVAIAKKAIDLGPPGLKELLNTTGLGNHPDVVRWAYRVGKALSEGSFVPGSPKPDLTGQDRADRLYPSTASK
jgi:hypothetical protein